MIAVRSIHPIWRSKSGSRILALTLIIIPLASIFASAAFLIFPSEDAVILFEYSKNLAERGLITYAQASYPIEGATDFLWMIVIAGLHKLGMDDYISALLLNCLSAILILFMFSKNIHKTWLVGFGLLITPFLYASLLGFSALTFSAAYVCVLRCANRSSRLFYLSVLLLCLLRPDGAIWGAGSLLYRWIVARPAFKSRAELLPLGIYLLIPGFFYFAWRATYFAEWLPLPFFVKAEGGRDFFVFYMTSTKNVLQALFPLLLAAFLCRNRGQVLRAIGLAFIIPIIFYSLMRLDQNVGNRFLAPMFFGGIYILSLYCNRLTMTAAIILSAIAMNGAARLALEEIRLSKSETVFYLARDLGKLRGSMLATESGRLAYYTGWDVEDSWGLNTPRFAKQPISLKTIAERPYDLIAAHCGYFSGKDYLFTGTEPLPRSWENQCKVAVSHITKGGYRIYLVPFFARGDWIAKYLYLPSIQTPDPRCSRYDIFAVSDGSPLADRVAAILKNYGAIASPYDPSKYRERADELCVAE